MVAMELRVILVLALIVFAFILYWIFDRPRYQGECDSSKARPTLEVFRDPESGDLIRVHEDPETGEREYRLEDKK